MLVSDVAGRLFGFLLNNDGFKPSGGRILTMYWDTMSKCDGRTDGQTSFVSTESRRKIFGVVNLKSHSCSLHALHKQSLLRILATEGQSSVIYGKYVEAHHSNVL